MLIHGWQTCNGVKGCDSNRVLSGVQVCVVYDHLSICWLLSMIG